MQANNHLHKISPEKVVRGEKAWGKNVIVKHIDRNTNKPELATAGI